MSDPYWSSVGLLAVNDNAADASATFTDQSASAHTITAVGNAQYDTAYAPTGMTSSGLIATNTDYLTVPGHANFNFGTGDFTVDFFYLCPATLKAYQVFFDTGSQGFAAQCSSPSTALIFVVSGGIGLTSSAHGMTSGNWYHLAWTRASGVLYIHVAGTQKGTYSYATGCNDSTTLRVGQYSGGGNYGIASNIANLRVTKGVARYGSENFTPPSLPLPTTGVVTLAMAKVMHHLKMMRG